MMVKDTGVTDPAPNSQSGKKKSNKSNKVVLDFSPKYKINIHGLILTEIIIWISKWRETDESLRQSNSKSFMLDMQPGSR